MQKLLLVLQNLRPLDSESIRNCLKAKPQDWEIESYKLSGLSGSSIGGLSSQAVVDIFVNHTSQVPTEKLVALDKLTDVSRVDAKEQSMYNHSDY